MGGSTPDTHFQFSLHGLNRADDIHPHYRSRKSLISPPVGATFRDARRAASCPKHVTFARQTRSMSLVGAAISAFLQLAVLGGLPLLGYLLYQRWRHARPLSE